MKCIEEIYKSLIINLESDFYMSEVKVNKPWGWERWISVNEKYVMKQLFMKKGNRCSLQYHEKKHETLFMQEGEMKMTLGTIDNPRKDEVILKPDEYYII